MKEAEVQRTILLEAPRLEARLLRNNVGAYEDKTGRWVHYGVGGNGGSDLIGTTTVRVTHEMVGALVGVFTAVEVKGPTGKTTEQQDAFLAMVRSRGGIACVARCVEDVQGAIREFTLRAASDAARRAIDGELAR